MPPAIHKAFLVLACLARISEERRVHSEAAIRSQKPLDCRSPGRSGEWVSARQRALAVFLFGLSARASFNPSAQGLLLAPVKTSAAVSSQPAVSERWIQSGHHSTLPPVGHMTRSAVPCMADIGGTSLHDPVDFNASTAVWAAGFAFEAYNQPSEQDARWERGADGIDVAFMSNDFAQEVYSGILEVRLCEAKDLEEQDDLAQKLVSGSQRDPYLVVAMNEENEDGPKEGAIGLGRAVDVQRSSTVWSKSLIDQWKTGTKGSTVWPKNESLYLYVKDPNRAQLALTMFDEEVLAADIPLGATSLHMVDFINPEGTPEEREWSGWVPLTWRPEEVQDGAVNIGVVAGAALAGPVGAVAGGLVGSLIKKPVQGELRLELKYTPLASAALRDDQGAKQMEESTETMLSAAAEDEAAMSLEAQRKELELQKQRAIDNDDFEEAARVRDALKRLDEQELASKGNDQDADTEGTDAGDADAELSSWSPVLTTGAAPKGGSAGVDWSRLAKRVGSIGTDEREDFELCCFLTHRDTSSEVAMWRKRSSRILIIAFRGTSDVLDVLTDVNLLQTPLEQGYAGQKSDDPRMVHSGFFASARAINQRLKELLVAACAGTPGEWSLLVTGHSLGGALASLMAPDLIGKVDVSRGFKERPDQSWWGQAQNLGKEFFSSAKEAVPGAGLPRFREVQMYTFGAPRVGNSEFARYFDETFGPAAFRIVNGADVVPRLPRHGNAAGAVLDYEHVGRTVLITEDAEQADEFDGFWVEGTSEDDKCPLRDVSPLSNPFSSGQLLGDVGGQAMGFAAQTWEKIDKAAKIKSRSQLQAAVAEATQELARTRESITERIKQVNPLEVVSMIGLDKKFVESEVQLAESLATGKAIEHHLEPSYFEAMSKALAASLRKDAA